MELTQYLKFPGVDEAEKGINWSKWVCGGMKFANTTFKKHELFVKN